MKKKPKWKPTIYDILIIVNERVVGGKTKTIKKHQLRSYNISYLADEYAEASCRLIKDIQKIAR